MKICVYGCGAIGSLIAARLADGGANVSVLARGAHLAAMQANGLKLLPMNNGEPLTASVNASGNPVEIGVQDVVFLTLKSHSVPGIADEIAPLLGPNTVVVTAYNGLPWWYFYGADNDFGIPGLTSVDPGGRLWQSIGPERALGCVVYPAAAIESPGVVRHVFGDRFTIGEPDGRPTVRAAAVSGTLELAGFTAEVSSDIRTDLWAKLVANAAFNPISVITGKTLGEMMDDAATYRLLQQVMAEVIEVAAALAVDVPVTPGQLLAVTRQLGNHKTSMLQDYEAGRKLELAAVVDAVLEVASLRGVSASNLKMVRELVGAKEKSAVVCAG
jgi:2-dehydropantoate 2-reductase